MGKKNTGKEVEIKENKDDNKSIVSREVKKDCDVSKDVECVVCITSSAKECTLEEMNQRLSDLKTKLNRTKADEETVKSAVSLILPNVEHKIEETSGNCVISMIEYLADFHIENQKKFENYNQTSINNNAFKTIVSMLSNHFDLQVLDQDKMTVRIKSE
jgi:hypothetical protein